LSPLPFVPSGADYDGSRRFFADLGFDEIWEHDGYAGFRNAPPSSSSNGSTTRRLPATSWSG
jgi:hypothetical protein